MDKKKILIVSMTTPRRNESTSTSVMATADEAVVEVKKLFGIENVPVPKVSLFGTKANHDEWRCSFVFWGNRPGSCEFLTDYSKFPT